MTYCRLFVFPQGAVTQPLAFVALSQMFPDSNWYHVSGATNLIAPDRNDLSIHPDYDNTKKIAVGNGRGLRQLIHISTSLYTSDGPALTFYVYLKLKKFVILFPML